MGAKRHITNSDRRLRLVDRHLLAPDRRAQHPEGVARALVALHATDPATVFLSAAARLAEPTVAAIEAALYDDRTLVRMLGMRRTMFVVPRELVPVVQAACTQAVAIDQRKLAHQLFRRAALADDVPAWTRHVEQATLAALHARGEATARDLGRDVPELKRQILMAPGKNYSTVQGIANRILMLLAADGHIVRGRPLGTWISTQYRWQPIERWLGQALDECVPAAAQAELVRRWLHAFGPGTLTDLKWWTGLTVREVTRALANLDTVSVTTDDGDAVMLATDVDAHDAAAMPESHAIALLPALDPTPMGYSQRDWFLGPHADALFDRTGNIGPTVWCRGRIVGGWAQRPSGEIGVKLLEDIGRAVEHAVLAAAADLQRWLGATRIVPRFRTPLDRELSA